jgi:hypothetical protein
MNERALADVLLARALEAADPQQTIATEAIRQRANKLAQVEIGRHPKDRERAKQERFLASRAEALLDAVSETRPAISALRLSAYPHERF